MDVRRGFLTTALAIYILVCCLEIGNATTSCGNVTRPSAFCPSECQCVSGAWKCCRVRREFLSMTKAERKHFVDTVNEAKQNHSIEWTVLLDSHQYNFYGHIHTSYYFLPWHRCFLLKFENLLRKVSPCITVPYFDWSVFGNNAMAPSNPIWSDLEGMVLVHPGNVLMDHLNIKTTALAGNTCLIRSPSAEYYLINKAMVDLILTLEAEIFEVFEAYMRVNVHDMFHCAVGGVMCTISAANDPIFFLHHGFVDKVWSQWQGKSSVHGNAFFPEISLFPAVSGIHPSACIKNAELPDGVKVCYAETNHTYASSDSANGLEKDVKSPPAEMNVKALNLFNTREIVKESADLTSQVIHIKEHYGKRFPRSAMMSTLRDINKEVHNDNKKLEKKLLSKNFRKTKGST